jgi:quercetin dioxygenase-like cupin family protein
MQAAIVRKEAAERITAEWGALVWNAGSRIGPSSELTVGTCIIKPGHANSPHSHPNCEEVLRVESGAVRHTIDGTREETLRPGDTIIVPRGLVHHARNIGDVDAVLTIAFSSAVREVKGE